LNRNGAVALSTALANAIAAKLSRPSPEAGYWVSLPRYRPSKDVSKAVDFSESLVLIAKEKEVKKARR